MRRPWAPDRKRIANCGGTSLARARPMSSFRAILVATDFGKPAQRAADWAVTLAERLEARLTLLFVLSMPRVETVSTASLSLEALREQARKTLEVEAARLRQRLAHVIGVMRSGTPSEEILAEATERGADLIVLGTQGRRGLPRALLGSVAERVLRMAAIPVLTVAAPQCRLEPQTVSPPVT